jgi:hypothetical protein
VSRRLTVGGGVVLLVGLAIWSSVAWPDGSAGGQDGGSSASVSAAESGSAPETPGSSTAPEHGDSGGKRSDVHCTSAPVELSAAGGFSLPPGGTTPGWWYRVTCSDPAGVVSDRAVWVPTTTKSAPVAPLPAADPGMAAAQADASIVLPAPTLSFNPSTFTVVNLPTWLTIDPSVWHAYAATATVGGVTATAVATPVAVTWTMGDGATVQCAGPGTAYNAQLPDDQQSTTCAHTYARSSQGEPSSDGNPDDGAFPVTATISWTVTWTAVGAPGGGDLPVLHTTSTTSLRVEQVESIDATA